MNRVAKVDLGHSKWTILIAFNVGPHVFAHIAHKQIAFVLQMQLLASNPHVAVSVDDHLIIVVQVLMVMSQRENGTRLDARALSHPLVNQFCIAPNVIVRTE